MGALRTSLTSLLVIAVVLELSVVARAENLVAGPLPATAISDTITCSVINKGSGTIAIGMTIVDAKGSGVSVDCPSIAVLATCSVTLRANRVGDGVSPFSCLMGGFPNPGSPISGTICVRHLFTAPVPPFYTCIDGTP